ncbi:unnamed protein product [Closterium sp. Naga37s-1]|nr:unnamed protein product [Closterium sp. Naga37s-1]
MRPPLARSLAVLLRAPASALLSHPAFHSSSSFPYSPPHSRVQLGVCVTVLKQQCREHGIARWPFRKIRKLDHMLCALEGAVNRPGAASSSKSALTAQQAHTNHKRKRKIGAVKETLSGLLTDPNSAAHLRLGKIKYKRFRPFLAEDDRNIRPRPLHASAPHILFLLASPHTALHSYVLSSPPAFERAPPFVARAVQRAAKRARSSPLLALPACLRCERQSVFLAAAPAVTPIPSTRVAVLPGR